MRRRAFTVSSSVANDPSSRVVPLSIYSHVSTYRSYQLELQLYSPSLRVDARGPLAVFNDHNQVGGKAVLDCEAYHTGTLTISIEGTFIYSSQSTSSPYSEARKHVFFNSSTSMTVSPSQDPSSSHSSFRDAFMRRRPSQSVLSYRAGMAERSYPFRFSLPQGCRPGQELPPSYSSASYRDDGSMVPSCEITYKVVASWTPDDHLEPPSHLEVPIVLQPDSDFQSKDAAMSSETDSWLEMPLKSERPIPVRCAVTLPTSVTFCRSSSIPYFVVFTTTPRSPGLAKEIAADASISISLIRQITIHDPQPTFPLTPPPSPSSSISEEPESPRPRLLRRVAKSASRLNINRKRPFHASMDFRDKPLPELPPPKSFSQSHTIHNDICIGFPKRPRQQCDFGRHPSLETHSALPDGLHKAKISLERDMLPCIDWAGVSVKYYLDVSVLIGQDDLRARVPVRIF